MANAEIGILIDEDLKVALERSWLQHIVELVFNAEDIRYDTEIGLVITNQETVQQLNRDYRGKDAPTDVLAFSMLPEPPADNEGVSFPSFVTPPDGVRHLGEVIISYPQAEAQAKEHGHPVAKEIAILIIHGVLHLLGYDHDTPELENLMSTQTEAILRDTDKPK